MKAVAYAVRDFLQTELCLADDMSDFQPLMRFSLSEANFSDTIFD